MTGGPEGSGIPLELEEELLDEEDELLLELEEELELLEFELLELDELELLDPPPELLLPPHAARAAARINATLDFVRPGRPTDLFKRFIKHIPLLCDLPFETIVTAKFTVDPLALEKRKWITQ